MEIVVEKNDIRDKLDKMTMGQFETEGENSINDHQFFLIGMFEVVANE